MKSAWASAPSGLGSNSLSTLLNLLHMHPRFHFVHLPLTCELRCDIKHGMTMYHKVLNCDGFSSVGEFCVKQSLLNILQLLFLLLFKLD